LAKTPREVTGALFAPSGGAHAFDLEDRGGAYLENFDEFLQVYTASHTRRQYSSKFHLINYFEEPVNFTMLSTGTRYHQLQTAATSLSQLCICSSNQDIE
jgi:hypothetical protein